MRKLFSWVITPTVISFILQAIISPTKESIALAAGSFIAFVYLLVKLYVK